jgi:hypothetical protein
MTLKCWIDNSECFAEQGGDVTTEHCRLCQEARNNRKIIEKWDGRFLSVDLNKELKAKP